MSLRILYLLISLFSFVELSGQQRVIFGDRAPKLALDSYIYDNRLASGKATYLEFFMLDSPHSIEQLKSLSSLADKYHKEMNFILVSKDDPNELLDYFKDKNISYSVAYDKDGRTFKLYGVLYVPLSALINKKGEFVWQGRSSEVSEITILNSYK